jgi:demethoxyubiquinone hydroxylase (CLK1/Coq7/Cat5 family)
MMSIREASRLLLLWRAAAFVTGSCSALFGTNVVYATIYMVETWLDNYYRLLQAKLGPDMYRTPEMVRQGEIVDRDEGARHCSFAYNIARRFRPAVCTCGTAHP